MAAILLFALVASGDEDLLYGECLVGIAGCHESSTSGEFLDSGQWLVSIPSGGRGGSDCAVVADRLAPNTFPTTDDFVNLADHTKSVTESGEGDFRVPTETVASNLYVKINTAPGTGDKWRITLRDDLTSTTLTCDIDDLETECRDTENTPTLAAGSALTVWVDSGEGGSAPDFPDTMVFSFCLDDV